MGERVINPYPEEGSKAEQFFLDKLHVIPVTREEFLKIVAQKYPERDSASILQMKGINFDQDNATVVLIRTDIFPEQYMPYLETHEKWEAYVARKPGYNLYKKSVREYKKNKNISSFDQNSRQEFLDELDIYNYEFRHELAIYKEYQQALQDGKLDEYHNWLMNLREKEKVTADPSALQLIQNDTEIRNSIYRKLTENSKHNFLRK
jgi:hypothetical protein